MAGTGGVLVGTDHPGVDPDRPLDALDHVGNSGSPVADPTTHHVIGLYIGGRYGLGNYAGPMWMLIGDPLLAKGGVKFQ